MKVKTFMGTDPKAIVKLIDDFNIKEIRLFSRKGLIKFDCILICFILRLSHGNPINVHKKWRES